MQMMKRISLAALLIFACATAATSAAQGAPSRIKTANGTPIVVGGGGSNRGNGISRNFSPGNSNGGAGNFAGSSAAGNATGNNGQHRPTK